ncbi:MAG: phosphopantetheine-binding protein [Clostridia bacterium]|nr:phosphopantetheine-binding protein [Clostridia bacterium]
MDAIKDTLLNMLSDLHPDVDFESETNLIDNKILDSFDIVSLIADINDELDVAITADKIVPENFNSLEALTKLVFELSDED